MTRIIAGSSRGRRLTVPANGTRPTSDRVREALFSTITSTFLAEGRPWSAVRVLDLYSGSGALGLEAASRGAGAVLLVEKARPAVDVIRKNIEAVNLSQVALLPMGVELLHQRTPFQSHELVFADPPYAMTAAQLAALLQQLFEDGWIALDAIVVVERPANDRDSPFPPDWHEFDQRRYGDTCLWYGRSTATTGE